MLHMEGGKFGIGIDPINSQWNANVHIHHQGDDDTTAPEYNLLISQLETDWNDTDGDGYSNADELTKVTIGLDPFLQQTAPVEIYAQQKTPSSPLADLVFATQGDGTMWNNPVIDRLKIKADGHLQYPHSTKGEGKILTSIDADGNAEWQTKEELGIAVPGLHAVQTTCDGEGELKGDTDIYVFMDTTSGTYANNRSGDTYTDDKGRKNRAIIYEALTAWYNQYKIDNPDFTGKMYIGQHVLTGSSERWLHHLPLICSSDVNLRTDVDTSGNIGLGLGFDGSTNTVGTSTTLSGDNDLGKWMENGSYTSDDGTSYTWEAAGMPPNWDNSNYELPTRVFIIDFNNEAQADYQFHSYWDGSTTVNNQRVGGVHIPLSEFWSTLNQRHGYPIIGIVI